VIQVYFLGEIKHYNVIDIAEATWF